MTRSANATKQILGGGPDGREKYGVIVTFENTAGELLTLHQLGPPSEALLVVLARALASDETFRVVSYSNPQTIYVDLVGGRADYFDQNGSNNPKPMPEVLALGRLELSHLCHPRLQGANRTGIDLRTRR